MMETHNQRALAAEETSKAHPFDTPEQPIRIALDMDGVLASSHVIMENVIQERYGVSFPPEAAYQWDAEKSLFHLTGVKMSGQEYLDLFDDVWKRWREIPMMDSYATTAIKELKDEGYTVHIVTYSKTHEQMIHKGEWLAKKVMPLLWMVNARDTAGWKYELDYDVFIEDCPHIAVGAFQRGRIAILYDQPWNRGVDSRLISFRVGNLMSVPFMIKNELEARE